MRSALRLLWEALREIFDENAYARFLAAHRRTASRQAYADFLEQRFSAGPRRCC